jgi:hypothetical protein
MTVQGSRMVVAVALGCLLIGVHGNAGAFPVDGDQTALPQKTELNEDALESRARYSGPKRAAVANPIWSISAIWLSVRRGFSAAWRDRPA